MREIPVRLEPLGDQAVTAYCDDEAHALAFAASIRGDNPAWLVDVVQAYVSVAVFYDLTKADFFQVAEWLQQATLAEPRGGKQGEPRLHHIPCCYEFGLDFDHIAQHTGLSREEAIAFHLGDTYTVYAIGFCPGFPYLGYLPTKLAGAPRLASPRLRVDAGSVGLTGRQTGIYTEPRPGGWNIVGKTPLQLVDVKDGYFPLRTGDQVTFFRIDEHEHHKLSGSRLESHICKS